MAETATICATCKNLYVVGKTDHWFRWLCYAKKREAEFNPVTGETVADPPYDYCRHINFGMCVHYEKGPNSRQPQSVQEYMEGIANG